MFKLLVVTAIVAAGLVADNWKSDAEHAKVSFTVEGPFGKVNGNFSGLKSQIKFDENDLAHSSFTASIDAKSVSTGIGLRNRDLRKKEIWLDTDHYPRISYHSSKIQKADKGFKADGELTIKNTTKPVEIPFTFSSKGNEGVFKGHFAINREEFKVGNKGGTVGETINITLDVPVSK